MLYARHVGKIWDFGRDTWGGVLLITNSRNILGI